MQTQSNCKITSNTQLKTPLFSDVILNSFFQSKETPSQCKIFIFLGGTLDHTTTMAYAVLITVASIITCPITTVLNATSNHVKHCTQLFGDH